jgi:hypothetical protein
MLLSIWFGFLISLVSAIPTISTKGSKFFTSDGNQFFLKGMPCRYSPRFPTPMD